MELQGWLKSEDIFVLCQCKPETSLEEEKVQYGTRQKYRAWCKRGFGKRIRNTSPAIRRTLRHTALLTVELHLAGEETEVVVNTGARASVVGKRLTCKLEIWKTARKVKVRQRDGSSVGGNFVVNTLFKVMDSCLVLGKIGMDAEVLDIRNSDVILGLS